jgi:hypothetical protein
MNLNGKRREWAPGLAFLLYTIFTYLMYFFIHLNTGSKEIPNVFLLNTAGCLIGALFLPLLLPLGALREGRRPGRYYQRLIFLGLLFFSSIIVRFSGTEAV